MRCNTTLNHILSPTKGQSVALGPTRARLGNLGLHERAVVSAGAVVQVVGDGVGGAVDRPADPLAKRRQGPGQGAELSKEQFGLELRQGPKSHKHVAHCNVRQKWQKQRNKGTIKAIDRRAGGRRKALKLREE